MSSHKCWVCGKEFENHDKKRNGRKNTRKREFRQKRCCSPPCQRILNRNPGKWIRKHKKEEELERIKNEVIGDIINDFNNSKYMLG